MPERRAPAATIVEGLVESSQLSPFGSVFFPGSAGAIRTMDLEDASARRATFLLTKQFPANAVIGLLMPTGPQFLVELFGVLRAGAAASVLPLRPAARHYQADMKQLAELMTSAGIRYLIAAPPFDKLADELREVCPELTLVEAGSAECRASLPQIYHSRLAMVQFTAGTTGFPKSVTLSHGEAVAGMRAVRWSAGLGPDDVLIQWSPLHHHLGLFGLLSQILAGGSAHVFTPEIFRVRGHLVLKYLSEWRGSVTIGSAPSYEVLCDAAQSGRTGRFSLARWRVALAGGPVRRSTVERFTEAFAASGVRPSTLYPAYHLAEAIFAVTCKQPDTDPVSLSVDEQALEIGKVLVVRAGTPNSREYISAGVPVVGMRLHIVDRAGNVRGNGQAGEIHISGAAVTSGYHRNIRTTLKTIDKGWLRTGDQGFLWKGELFITGRNGPA